MIGIVFVVVTGSAFLDWEWGRPDDRLLPLVIGVLAAVVAVTVVLQKRRN